MLQSKLSDQDAREEEEREDKEGAAVTEAVAEVEVDALASCCWLGVGGAGANTGDCSVLACKEERFVPSAQHKHSTAHNRTAVSQT